MKTRHARRQQKTRALSARLHRLAAAALGAAAGVAVLPAMGSLLGQNLFPTNNPWNQDISGAPVAANSASVIAKIGGSRKIHPDWGTDSPTNGTSPLYGIPYNVVHGNSTAKVNVIIDNYPGESDLLAVPIPANAVIEGDYQNGPNPNGPGYTQNANERGDSHLIVWDEDNNIGYELYGAARPADPVLIDGTSHTDGKWHAAQESVWHYSTNAFRALGYTSADAAGLPVLAGLVRPDEGLPIAQGGQGAIQHALRLTLSTSDGQYIYPASHVTSGSTGYPPFGARFRLKNTTAINNLIATMGPEAQIVARAMQKYGLIFADNGSSMYVTGASAAVNAANGLSLTWNMDDIVGGLSQLPASDFDLVDLTPAVTSLSQGTGAAGTALTINGYNFSGAAGHLSIFFGTNAAAAPNVLGDSQISVTVPAGSGTVDVTVRSGLYEPDTNDGPGANVHEPIFGYGTSATTAADKFTYLAAVPSIQHIAMRGGNLTLSGTNPGGAGGTYHVLVSPNLQLPLTNWTVLAGGSFDSNGNFAFTNALAPTNTHLFYQLRVP